MPSPPAGMEQRGPRDGSGREISLPRALRDKTNKQTKILSSPTAGSEGSLTFSFLTLPKPTALCSTQPGQASCASSVVSVHPPTTVHLHALQQGSGFPSVHGLLYLEPGEGYM